MTRLLVQPLALSSQLSLIHEYHLVINGVLSCTILLPNHNQIHQRTGVPADHSCDDHMTILYNMNGLLAADCDKLRTQQTI